MYSMPNITAVGIGERLYNFRKIMRASKTTVLAPPHDVYYYVCVSGFRSGFGMLGYLGSTVFLGDRHIWLHHIEEHHIGEHDIGEHDIGIIRSRRIISRQIISGSMALGSRNGGAGPFGLVKLRL